MWMRNNAQTHYKMKFFFWEAVTICFLFYPIWQVNQLLLSYSYVEREKQTILLTTKPSFKTCLTFWVYHARE